MMAQATVMVVGEDDDLRAVLHTALVLEGYRVILSSPEETIDDVITADNLVAVVLDASNRRKAVWWPARVTWHLRRCAGRAHVPIVVLAFEHDAPPLAPMLPVDAWLVKPFDLRDLYWLLQPWRYGTGSTRHGACGCGQQGRQTPRIYRLAQPEGPSSPGQRRKETLHGTEPSMPHGSVIHHSTWIRE